MTRLTECRIEYAANGMQDDAARLPISQSCHQYHHPKESSTQCMRY
ncbi:MAG: hypothetical protein ABI575_07970 [Oxalobacteraceae bacterium]